MHSTPTSSEHVTNLDQAIDQAFSIFDKTTLNGAVVAAWAGEIYGAASFDYLSRDSVDTSEKRFWELARDVELLTLRKLEMYFLDSGFVGADAEIYRNLGEITANVFAGAPHHSYCEWVAPQIAAAMNDFGLLREKLDGTPLGVELYDHEAAFVSAWGLLGQGFEKAAQPFKDHLVRYSVSAVA